MLMLGLAFDVAAMEAQENCLASHGATTAVVMSALSLSGWAT